MPDERSIAGAVRTGEGRSVAGVPDVPEIFRLKEVSYAYAPG
jgi:hypothetical protein